MRKNIIGLLATGFAVTLVACGGGTGNSSDDGQTVATGQQDTVHEAQAEDTQVQSANNMKENGMTNNEISFEEIVVVDNDQCFIKISDIDPENIWGYTLKAQFENKSADTTYMFLVESASINGVQSDPMFASEVAPGEKANGDIIFIDSSLEENGIVEYTDIELTFRVYDYADWSADSVARETIHIYPYGEDKATKFEREPQSSDKVLIDNEYVSIIYTGYEKDEIWGYKVNLFLLNKSDVNLMFSADDVSVNGYMADPLYATFVSSGKCAFGFMSWSDTSLLENGITDVEEIKLRLRAYNPDDIMSEDLANEVITLHP